jgi:hypothetical protein
MNLLEKSDEEILEIANPLWDDLVKSSNKQDYFEFVKNFSAKMLFGANEIEERVFLGCIRRNDFVTVLFKQKSNVVVGDFLGRLVLGIEDKEIKIFGATIF